MLKCSCFKTIYKLMITKTLVVDTYLLVKYLKTFGFQNSNNFYIIQFYKDERTLFSSSLMIQKESFE